MRYLLLALFFFVGFSTAGCSKPKEPAPVFAKFGETAESKWLNLKAETISSHPIYLEYGPNFAPEGAEYYFAGLTIEAKIEDYQLEQRYFRLIDADGQYRKPHVDCTRSFLDEYRIDRNFPPDLPFKANFCVLAKKDTEMIGIVFINPYQSGRDIYMSLSKKGDTILEELVRK